MDEWMNECCLGWGGVGFLCVTTTNKGVRVSQLIREPGDETFFFKFRRTFDGGGGPKGDPQCFHFIC